MPPGPRALASAQRRDSGALLERLYAENRQRLLAIARRNCDSAEDAEEALQDALVLFIERFDPDCGSPALPWLMLTLKRRCWAIYGRRRQLADLLAEAGREGASLREERSVEELAEIAELIARLGREMRTLGQGERRALALLVIGCSYGEIAERLGCTPKRVDHMLQRARERLRLAAGAGAA